MASEREIFDLSGPSHLPSMAWQNTQHQRSVAASLVQGVYVVELDRQKKREGSKALAPLWWKFFHFKLLRKLVDDVDCSIFGAIYEFEPLPRNSPLEGIPRFVIAFRGTLWKRRSFLRDLKLDLEVVRNGLHRKSRFEIAMQAVDYKVDEVGDSNVCLAGHSLGSAVAMLAGKEMGSKGILLKSFLFNPPFPSAPIEWIEDMRVKDGIRIGSSVTTTVLYFARKAIQQPQERSHSEENPFTTLSAWFPSLFVNQADFICSEYKGYFEQRLMMQGIGLGLIERLATQHSIVDELMKITGRHPAQGPPLHLIPSANLTVNLTPSRDPIKAHGIHQWWRNDQQLQSVVHQYRQFSV